MEQLIVHKPNGTVISDSMMEKIKKEYTNTEVFYCFRHRQEGWFYSQKTPKLISQADFLGLDYESFIIFDKGVHYHSKPNPVNHREANNGVQWFLNSTVGSFTFLSGANDRCSGIMFDTFLKFCDLNSLNSFLKEVCHRYNLKSYVVTNSSTTRYGTWFQNENCFYTTLDFANKLAYDAKASLKNIIAFLINPNEFKQEVSRLDELSDYEIRIEAAKYPEVEKILQQIG